MVNGSDRLSQAELATLKIGIAFSGGGARGIAHVGVIRALREEGIEPAVVSGTSAGAIVGALYCAGMKDKDLEHFANVGSGIKILRLGNPLRGLMKLSLLREKLEAVLSTDDFTDLQVPFIVTASNLQGGYLRLFSEGPLIEAVQASCAFPLIFEPIVIDDEQYIDGGLYLNLPAEPIRDACDFLIGSNVMPLVNERVEPLKSLVSIATRVFDLSVNTTSHHSRATCDVLIEPADVIQYGIYNFSKPAALIEAGYRAAKAEMPVLRKSFRRVMREHRRAREQERVKEHSQENASKQDA